MARTAEECRALFDEFIIDKFPRWVFHPEVTKLLNIRKLFVKHTLPHRNRGMATNDGRMWICTEIVKFRAPSPYTSPGGKSDISPIGVLAHELGHMLEFAVARQGLWDEEGWRAIHRDHRRSAITSYAKVHPMEDFAESHRLFLLNPKLLKELSPERYAFVRNCWTLLLGKRRKTAFKQSRAEFRTQWSAIAR